MNKMTHPAVLVCVVLGAGVMLGSAASPQAEGGADAGHRALKSVTINTQAYTVAGKGVDLRSVGIAARQDMHIVGIEHFTGVQGGAWSDNGHMLSLREENPWSKWGKASTGMEPSAQEGYFGYCGRDYYSEVGGIDDVMAYEMFPAGTHVFVPAGKKIYMHCYANNFLDQPKAFHHTVRLLYW